MNNSSLIQQVDQVIRSAATAYAGTPAEPSVKTLAVRVRQPLRVAIAGKVKAGKSTLLNALIGEELAATDAGECTRIITWFQHGAGCRVLLQPKQGEPRQVRYTRPDSRALEIDLGGARAAEVERLVVEWPSTALRNFMLIDTPGIGSVSTDISERAQDFLTPADGRVTPADAVLYLMRYAHNEDIRLLEAFHDDDIVQPTPVNAVGVLSRADEIGAGKMDSMASAARVADTYRRSEQVRRLCQTVLPVTGLLAYTGRTLREQEYHALDLLAKAPADALAPTLVSVDRFIKLDCPAAINAEWRSDLLRRLGLYGLRLGIELIRSGKCTSSAQLAAMLIEHSGLRQLVAALGTQFAARAEVLKARSALQALGSVLRQMPLEGNKQLSAEVERVWAGAHEIAELRLLNSLRQDPAGLTEEEVVDAERLLGSSGVTTARRLGLAPDADAGAVQHAAQEALARWQRRAENPASLRQSVSAAQVLIRTCEGMLGDLELTG
ncbi:dynamin family protein [Saccharopolyspora sp. NPDC000359]|uniref:dynamin family protein n=1 Tax=Saccharopolyspora sp. NPDC000359 TaxID=3154251 RepID=UPI003323B33C